MLLGKISYKRLTIDLEKKLAAGELFEIVSRDEGKDTITIVIKNNMFEHRDLKKTLGVIEAIAAKPEVKEGPVSITQSVHSLTDTLTELLQVEMIAAGVNVISTSGLEITIAQSTGPDLQKIYATALPKMISELEKLHRTESSLSETFIIAATEDDSVQAILSLVFTKSITGSRATVDFGKGNFDKAMKKSITREISELSLMFNKAFKTSTTSTSLNKASEAILDKKGIDASSFDEAMLQVVERLVKAL